MVCKGRYSSLRLLSVFLRGYAELYITSEHVATRIYRNLVAAVINIINIAGGRQLSPSLDWWWSTYSKEKLHRRKVHHRYSYLPHTGVPGCAACFTTYWLFLPWEVNTNSAGLRYLADIRMSCSFVFEIIVPDERPRNIKNVGAKITEDL